MSVSLKFTASQADTIRELLRELRRVDRVTQRRVRRRLRREGFVARHIDLSANKFTVADFDKLIADGRVTIVGGDDGR